MASTASDLLKFEKQATGENASTWGTKANTAMSRIEEAIAGYTAITMTGANYTLDDTQYQENSATTAESHLAIIKVTGTPGASYQLVVPLRTKMYLIWNTITTYDITIGGATGDTVTLPTGYVAYVFCDGTNVEFAAPPCTLAGVPYGFETSDSPQFTGIELGHASDTTLARSAAGVVTVEGTAIGMAGKHAVPIPAIAMYAPTTSGAASGDTETTTNAVQIKTWDFDASTDEYVQFQVPMPDSWNEGTVTAKFHWSHATTTTNFGVSWGIQAVAFGDSDALDAAWGTGIVTDDTGGTTDDLFITAESSAVTVAGSPAAGDLVIFRIYRDVSDANDDMAIDARLHGITLYITTDAGNDA